MASASIANQFLLALPVQNGTYFEDTITYICRHGDEGALGVVINRPLPIKLQDILSEAELPTDIDPEIVLVEGGPVSPSNPAILHTSDFITDSSIEVCEGISLTTDQVPGGVYATLRAISEGEGPAQYLVALGYAGWAEGQLEGELEENVWMTCPADKSIIFDTPYEQRVSRAASTIGIDFQKMSPLGGEA